MSPTNPTNPADWLRQTHREQHPPPEQLEAAAFGWLADDEAAVVRAHADGCARCGPLLAADEEVYRRLQLLRSDEPRVTIVQQVLQRLERLERPETRGSRQAARPPAAAPQRRRSPLSHEGPLGLTGLLGFAAVLCTMLLGVAVWAPGSLQAASQWLRTIVVREVPPPGQPSAPPARLETPGPEGGPIQRADLEEVRRAVAFPVALPRSMPAGFQLAEVTVFRFPPGAPPSQVHLTYRRPRAHQPLVLTYQAPGTISEVAVPPGAVRELVVGGYRAVYIDLAAEGIRPGPGASASIGPDGPGRVGEANASLQLGRLMVERPEVVLVAVGDRRDGLDASALAAMVASIP